MIETPSGTVIIVAIVALILIIAMVLVVPLIIVSQPCTVSARNLKAGPHAECHEVSNIRIKEIPNGLVEIAFPSVVVTVDYDNGDLHDLAAQINRMAYGHAIEDDGNLMALTHGDMGYSETGINLKTAIDEFEKS